MAIIGLIWTNIRRHRIRTAIGVTGIALGVATMLSVVGILGGAVRMFERILRSDAEMLVFEKGSSDLFFSNVPVTIADDLAACEFIDSARPVLFAVISSPGTPVITCFGISADDPRITSGKWIAGSPAAFTANGRAVALGNRAASFLNVTRAGVPIQLGQDQYTVAGILEMENGFESGGVFIPLPAAQQAFHKENHCSIISIDLAPGASPDALKSWIARHHPRMHAMENDEFSRSYSQFKIMKTTAWVVGGCAFLLGGLSVTNTMILSVFSRIRELAIARICGFSRSQLTFMIFGESLLICLIGTAAGWAACAAALRILREIPSLQGYVDPHLGWLEIAGATALAITTALLGALYPAFYAAKIKPASALRFE